MKDRFEIAADLRQIASLLRIKGENPFKIQAYERGAAALENLEGDLDRVIKGQGLRAIAGIGSGLSAVIEEIHRSGECRLLQQLIDELPPGAVELSEIPGLTLRKIIALNRDLHIESIAELKEACEEGLVSNIKGFGLKSQAKLLNDIESLEKPREHFLLLDAALAESERILNHLHGCPELVDAGVAGALRRRKETVSQICIVGASKHPQLVVDRFLQYPSLARTEELEAHRCLGRLAAGIPLELVIAQPEDYAATLHDRTGSRKHVAKLQGLAATGMTAEKNGRQLNRAKGPHPATEAEIYRRLGLPYIPPEIREDEGEIEAAQAGQLPGLVSAGDIRGITHCHTIYSDGRGSIEEMARAAEAMGMAYITITDHSQSAYYARGLSVDRLRAQWDEIARVQERVKIKLLKGTESDILADGALDYPEPLLEQLDVIIASIHTRHKMDSDQMTARLLRAIQAPFFKIWGHPLGRLLGSRPPFSCRMEEVLDGIAQSRAAIEINGDPRRLDLEPRWIRAARERGIKFIVSTDAHSTGGLSHLSFGIAMARRGWVAREEVLNTLDAKSFARAVHP